MCGEGGVASRSREVFPLLIRNMLAVAISVFLRKAKVNQIHPKAVRVPANQKVVGFHVAVDAVSLMYVRQAIQLQQNADRLLSA